MSNWRALVDEALSENTRNDRNVSPQIGPSVPSVPSVLVPMPLDPGRALKLWHSRLAPLDRSAPPEGIARNRWHQLVDDAWWLYEQFASQLAREGWSALDIFGVLPGYDVGAVLLDRLKGARNLKLSGERAFWSHFGVTSQTCRGCSAAVVSSGLVLVWELLR